MSKRRLQGVLTPSVRLKGAHSNSKDSRSEVARVRPRGHGDEEEQMCKGAVHEFALPCSLALRVL
jgi:hypothetical protein